MTKALRRAAGPPAPRRAAGPQVKMRVSTLLSYTALLSAVMTGSVVGIAQADSAAGVAAARSQVDGADVAATRSSAPRAFVPGSWQAIRAAHAHDVTIVHFWGLTCGPCLVELPLWGRLMREFPDARLVLVEAEPYSAPNVDGILYRAGLKGAESWSFAPLADEDRMRYEVDAAWTGELPKTVLIARDGTAKPLHDGSDFKAIRSWLKKQM